MGVLSLGQHSSCCTLIMRALRNNVEKILGAGEAHLPMGIPILPGPGLCLLQLVPSLFWLITSPCDVRWAFLLVRLGIMKWKRVRGRVKTPGLEFRVATCGLQDEWPQAGLMHRWVSVSWSGKWDLASPSFRWAWVPCLSPLASCQSVAQGRRVEIVSW